MLIIFGNLTCAREHHRYTLFVTSYDLAPSLFLLLTCFLERQDWENLGMRLSGLYSVGFSRQIGEF